MLSNNPRHLSLLLMLTTMFAVLLAWYFIKDKEQLTRVVIALMIAHFAIKMHLLKKQLKKG